MTDATSKSTSPTLPPYPFLSSPFLQNLGVGAWGYTEALQASSFGYFQKWQQSPANPFSYLRRQNEVRQDLRQLLATAQSALVFILPYVKAKKRYLYFTSQASGRVSGHSVAYDGLDYHYVGRHALQQIKTAMEQDKLRAIFLGGKTLEIIPGIDTGPVLEKDLAVRAQLGFIGRHGLLQTPYWGSYVFIAYLILNCRLDLPPSCNSYAQNLSDISALQNTCANCPGRCQQACPVHRWPANDVGQCLAAVTLEKEVGVAKKQDLYAQILGCDLCQDACPLNQKVLRDLAAAEQDHAIPEWFNYRDDFGRQQNVAANQKMLALLARPLPEMQAHVAQLSKRGFQREFQGTVLAYVGRDKFWQVLQTAAPNSPGKA